jgi:hypothetical protein
MTTKQRAEWVANAYVEKWTPEQVSALANKLGREPKSKDLLEAYTPQRLHVPNNMLTTAGVTRIMSLVNGAGGQALVNTATRLGVGNSSVPAAAGQTDLQAAAGASNRYFMTMDASYPSVSGGVLTAKATFGVNDANFQWQEWCIDVDTPTVTPGTTVNNVMINRKVANMGTKVSGAIWALTVTLTLA